MNRILKKKTFHANFFSELMQYKKLCVCAPNYIMIE